MEENRIIMEVLRETPEQAAASRKQSEQYKRNSDWLDEHILEIGQKHRGKVICVAGEELFVGDDVLELIAQAEEAHPDDTGVLTRYIPKERFARIYAVPR
jgi:hypothetical protein